MANFAISPDVRAAILNLVEGAPFDVALLVNAGLVELGVVQTFDGERFGPDYAVVLTAFGVSIFEQVLADAVAARKDAGDLTDDETPVPDPDVDEGRFDGEREQPQDDDDRLPEELTHDR